MSQWDHLVAGYEGRLRQQTNDWRTMSLPPPPPNVTLGGASIPPPPQYTRTTQRRARDIFVDTFILFGSHWELASGIALLVSVVQVLAFWLLLGQFDVEMLADSETNQFADLSVSWLPMVAGFGLLLVAGVLLQVALIRLFVAAAHGRRLSLEEVVQGTIGRIPYYVGAVVGLGIIAVSLMGLVGLLAILHTSTLFITVPLFLFGGAFAIPYLIVFGTFAAAGPRGRLLVGVRTTVRDQWGFIFRCGIILGLAPFVVGLGTSMLNEFGVAFGMAGLLLTSSIGAVAQTTISCAGAAAAHAKIGVPTCDSLTLDELGAVPSSV